MIKLKVLDLSHSHKLITTCDLSGLESLEKLILENCIKLVEVHESVANFSKLSYLNLRGCMELVNFPMSLFMSNSLAELDLSGCSKIFNPPSRSTAHGLICNTNFRGTGKHLLTLVKQYMPSSLSLLWNNFIRPPAAMQCGYAAY